MVAIRIDTALNPTITQSNLFAAIQAAFTNAGYASTFDNFTTGTDQCLVYEFVVDSTKTFGKVYLRIRVTSGLVIGQQIFSAWNSSAHTGTNGSTERTYSSFSTSSTITFTALNGSSEYKLIAIGQGTTLFAILGIIAPVSRPGWWDLNSWCYGFYFYVLGTLRGVATALLPYPSTDFIVALIDSSAMGTVNPQTGKPDLIQGLLLLSSSTGIAGRTSDDFAIGCFNGQTRLATANPTGTTQQYLIISNTAGGLGVRIA